MIPLGYEMGTGRRVKIPPAHLAVTGQTQASGKTTTLEGLISRSGRRAVAFVTKRGEGSFRTAREILPYFRETFEDRPMWEFVESVLEAAMKQKLKFERQWIIEACRDAETLRDVHAYVQKQITPVAVRRRAARKARKRGQRADAEEEMKPPARGLSYGVYTCLNAYFEKVMPQIERLPYVDHLQLEPGVNVMDLSAYSSELQALVIRSVLEWVYRRERNTVVIIPEAWEFIPQERGSPVRLAAEEFIRKGAALGNLLWIDSQDIAGVHKAILRQVGVWIVGVQREANEIARALKHLLSKPARPNPEEIMQLGRGEFLACFGKEQFHVYAQPAWVPDLHAQAIAQGIQPVSSAEKIWNERPHHPRQKPAPHPTSAGPTPTTGAGAGNGHALPAPSSGRVAADPVPELRDRALGDARDPAAGIPALDPAATPDQPDLIIVDPFAGMQESEEETMWKEKYEALSRDFEKLQQEVERLRGELAKKSRQAESNAYVHAAMGGMHASKEEIPSLDALYSNFRDRLLAEDPPILQVLFNQPEIEVKIERKTVQMNGDSLEGRIALLLHEGFFDSGVKGDAVTKEIIRRGYGLKGRAVGLVYMKLGELAKNGFLTREGTGATGTYTAVPGMKRNVVKA